MTPLTWLSPAISADGYAVLIHGGAGDVPQASRAAHQAGALSAALRAQALLAAGASALEAVEAAVMQLEDDPRFNAGTGGSLNSDGELELDASIMCGQTLKAGAVCALTGFKNPIAVARAALTRGEHVLYTAGGAARFALSQGFAPVEPATLITPAARDKLAQALTSGSAQVFSGGTVGAVARDRRGHLAAATSTGGTAGKHPGRVGDSPLIGAGSYADDALGACSATGYGEGMIRAVASYRAAALASASPEVAAATLVAELRARFQAPAGLIVVAPDGRLGWARSTECMSWAAATSSELTESGC